MPTLAHLKSLKKGLLGLDKVSIFASHLLHKHPEFARHRVERDDLVMGDVLLAQFFLLHCMERDD